MALPEPSASENRKYIDPEFPACSRVLAGHTKETREHVEWLRPYEIVEKPVFVKDNEFNVFDLDQGDTGDCWFIASVASLVFSRQTQLLNRCIPPGQSFKDGYAGKFKFNFWHFGEWREVVVDDRLPTEHGHLIYAHNRSQPDEFWVPLMEKAYAKLHGGYEKIEGGCPQYGAEDLTGGIAESIELEHFRKSDRSLLEILFNDLQAMMAKCTLLDSRIYGRSGDDELPYVTNGLVTGHAYSVLKMEVITDINKRQHNLVCIRNPWGQRDGQGEGEWSGKWSDSSSIWKNVPTAEKARIKFVSGDDGVFWMSFKEYITYFDSVDICHLTPDDISRQIAQKENWTKWKLHQFRGTFHYYESFDVPLVQPDGSSKCYMVVSLMQIHEGHEIDKYIDISFKISVLDKDGIWRHKAQVAFQKNREVVQRYSLDPGTYRITPSARFRSNTKLLLRIFADDE